ncbi:aluminum-activated malate transporter 12 isoform X2 [Canna indica]|uniref:Aluminum-activated malate transporter 12 isoform X2 n=1 Tax=Canna indica TaxID=4628 RepID=A0AAQ3KKM8_9LILI|nr:aluminum-activated malate transporter 12 isoform X2 [Canna indica]
MAMASCISKGKDYNYKILMEELVGKMISLPVKLWLTAIEVGREDPRRPIHALKVGVSLTLVSFLYLLEPLFVTVGQDAMWAVITVVVVLEFTAGATLCKGLNRGFGTLCAASLAFFIEIMSQNSGRVFHASFIGISVFLVGFLATYVRFVPYIKKNYDYGVVIFLLTFNLITVSSFRVHNVLHLTRDRLSTIAIGCGICLFMSLFILPNWSGEDLHNSTVQKLELLARSIEACVNKYFQDEDKEVIAREDKSSKDQIYMGYRAVLDSKSSDEALALFASWEPRHSRHCYSFPWQQYVKLGAVLRRFGCTAVALHGCLESEIKTPLSVRSLFRDPCSRVASEVCKVLDELARSIRSRRHCSPNMLSDHLHEALQDLNSAIKSQPRLFLGSKNARRTANALVDWRSDKNTSSTVALSSAKSDISSLLEGRGKRAPDTPKGLSERKSLRPTLSKIAITSLEFSEALPFAAFASLLVEMVARLELVIEEVEELSRAANFKFSQEDEAVIEMEYCEEKKPSATAKFFQSNVVSQTAE